MTEPVRVSNSEIQTFKECRRKWWLSYYEGFKPKGRDFTGPLALGSRVHLALENYYRDGVELLEEWGKLCEADRMEMAKLLRDPSDIDNEAELGRIMLEGYLDWVADQGIDSSYDIVSSEEILEAPFLDGRVVVQGKLDQRATRKTDGSRWIRDFKTAASINDLLRDAQLSEQFLTYQLLEMLKPDDETRVVGTLITVIKKVKRTGNAKPPFYQQIEVRHNVTELRNFWVRLNGVLSDMMAVRDALDSGADHRQVAYPTPSRDCHWKCQFFAVCPMFDDGSRIESAMDDLYDRGDPYDYYHSGGKEGT